MNHLKFKKNKKQKEDWEDENIDEEEDTEW